MQGERRARRVRRRRVVSSTNDPLSLVAVGDLVFTYKEDSKPPFPPVHALITDLDPATGEMVAASRETGAAERDDELVSFAL